MPVANADPPTNPSDQQIADAEQTKDDKAAELGNMSAELAQVQGRISRLEIDAEIAVENFNKAQEDYAVAREKVIQTKKAAEAAQKNVERARKRLGQVARGSYIQGIQVGSMASGLLGADDPADLLQRMDLIDYANDHQLDVVGRLQRTKVAQANANSLARLAADEAAEAKLAAEKASAQASRTLTETRRQISGLTEEVSVLQARTLEADAALNGLQAQRQRYQAWQEEQAKIAAEQERARLAAAQREAAQAAQPIAHHPSATWSAQKGQTVADAALRWLGTPYAWGGGTAAGPSMGSPPDAGVRGFDCSGLALWAWAQVGVDLPHFSGYQYMRGKKVETEDLLPGDLVFWSHDGEPSGIHHVAIWLGDGQIVEAPYSGSTVRITPMRWLGFIGATRPGR